MHVYFLPDAVEVAPSLVQEDPALTAALATPVTKVKANKSARNLNLLFKEFSQFESCRCHLNSLGKFSLLHKSSFLPNTSSH